MRDFRKPDLHAPRYRAKVEKILNKDFYDNFRKSNSKYSHLKDSDIRYIVKHVNGKIWNTVIEERCGVELPEQLGYIFIGSCPAPIKENPNYYISAQYKKIIQHRNWESDQYLAKIFYTNAASKYRFQFSNLWGFKPVRQFSRQVAKDYPENFNRYVVVDDFKRINAIFSKRLYSMDMKALEKEILKTTYNEFDL